MAYELPITAVGDAVEALFNADATLTALLPGGATSDVPQEKQYPFLWWEILHDRNYGGLGTRPGQGSMPGLTLRLHVFQADYGTMRDAQIVMARAVALLYGVPLVVAGYVVCSGIPLPDIDTIPLPDELLNGVKVKELICNLTLIVEEASIEAFQRSAFQGSAFQVGA